MRPKIVLYALASVALVSSACSTSSHDGSAPRNAAAGAGGACGNGAPLTAAQLRDVPRVACTDRPARVNGCGPNAGAPNAAAINTLLATPPVDAFSALFVFACNAHDACWGQCYDGTNDKGDKKACDTAFLNGLKAACATVETRRARVLCKAAARTFWAAVAIAGGGAWNNAQAYHCAPKGADAGARDAAPAADASRSLSVAVVPASDALACTPSDPFVCDVPADADVPELCVAQRVALLPFSDDGPVDVSSCGAWDCAGATTLADLEACIDSAAEPAATALAE